MFLKIQKNDSFIKVYFEPLDFKKNKMINLFKTVKLFKKIIYNKFK